MYNENGDNMILTFVILIIVIVILVMILNDNKKDFKTITFKDKKPYLIVAFLHGNCGLKTNKAVLSRNGDDFLLETEDKEGKVESFKFNASQIVNVEVVEQLGRKSGNMYYDNFTSPDTIGRHSTYELVKTTNFKKEFDIKIVLQGDIKIHMLSDKSPEFILKGL